MTSHTTPHPTDPAITLRTLVPATKRAAYPGNHPAPVAAACPHARAASHQDLPDPEEPTTPRHATPAQSTHPNPFDDDLARHNSSYAAPVDGSLTARPDAHRPLPPLAVEVHEQFRAFVLDPAFSCLGAQSALGRGAYRFGLYEDLGAAATTAGLARDLYSFVQELPHLSGGFTTYIAAFRGPCPPDEHAFERLLWGQLQRLHDADHHHHAWDPSVSPDPESADFSFSFAGTAFFVVGLHPAASRRARRFPYPVLVFNAHEQFVRLRANGHFDKLRALIREREQALQGDLNPNLADFGTLSEARQYAGRPTEPEWRCPFQSHATPPAHGA